MRPARRRQNLQEDRNSRASDERWQRLRVVQRNSRTGTEFAGSTRNRETPGVVVTSTTI